MSRISRKWLVYQKKELMMKTKVGVRFPNESCYQEVYIDMSKFQPQKDFGDEVFGWYGDTYIAIRNDK